MNPQKRRAKRIPNHPKNYKNTINDHEKQMLTLIAQIVADIAFLKVDKKDHKESESKL